jgi:hypothetical protein
VVVTQRLAGSDIDLSGAWPHDLRVHDEPLIGRALAQQAVVEGHLWQLVFSKPRGNVNYRAVR